MYEITGTFIQDVPKDHGGKILLQWDRSSVDTMPSAEISRYSVWRRVPKAAVSLFAGEAQEPWPLGVTVDFDDPAIRFYSSSGDSAWEWLANVPARHFETYALTVQSLYDSMGTDPGWQYFMISAHTNDPVVYYDSPVDSGYSVDNLSPCQPEGLAGEAIYGPPGLTLTWEPNSEPDIACYAVYRGDSVSFVPGPGNLISSPCNTTYSDNYQLWNHRYYKVSSIDVHGNESQFALLRPEDVTGGETPEAPLASFLEQNVPNPFNPATTIHFGLEKTGHVSLWIYDVAGRFIRVLVDEMREANVYDEVWDGIDNGGNAVASGVYFYQLRSGTFRETKKMVLLR
ncbi:MAG: T9SS type A sorting domain-containing protein [bacterium]|nr:MAG: T9SS type A sorting domain-containing protein [bacterium]